MDIFYIIAPVIKNIFTGKENIMIIHLNMYQSDVSKNQSDVYKIQLEVFFCTMLVTF